MSDNKKYNDYIQLCIEVNQDPFPESDHKWTTHKGQLCQNNINARKSISSNYVEQSAADDYLDYLNSTY